MEPGQPGFITPWELRVAHLRVYHEAREDPFALVTVRAIGIKVRNRLRIGNEWWEPDEIEEAKGSHEDPRDESGDG